jgi:hypothetical protein
MPLKAALALVADAEAWMWSPEGKDALAYLTGSRGLHGATIRAARLGVTPGVLIPKKGGGTYSARGIVIPWYDGDRLALVKIRQPDRDRPKYVEAFRDRPTLYPGPEAILVGRPLVIVEGEFDARLLGQELDGLAGVVTAGGTGSTKPEPAIRSRMRVASSWFLATDADDAGDKAAARWEGTRARRVRPPEPFKDWTEARQAGVDLRRWWADRLGVPFPSYSWESLAGWRWGPAAADPSLGLVIDQPAPGHNSRERQLAP